MNSKAIIGLGQSGSAYVEDLTPHLKEFDAYCFNTASSNENFVENIPAENMLCFGLKGGFSHEFERAFDYLKRTPKKSRLLMGWIHEILSTYEKVIFITHTISGTGVGSLLYIMDQLNKTQQLNDNIKGIMVELEYEERQAPSINSRVLIADAEGKKSYINVAPRQSSFKIKLKEFVSMKYLNIDKFILFVERYLEKGERIKKESNLYNAIHNPQRGRFEVFEVLKNRLYDDKEFVLKSHEELVKSVNRFDDIDLATEVLDDTKIKELNHRIDLGWKYTPSIDDINFYNELLNLRKPK